MVLGNAIGIRGNPLRVAEEIAMLDHLSNGRVISGFVRGIGWEYFGHSINPTRSRDRFTEAHDLIVKACTADERAHREARPALEWLFRKGLKQTAQQHSPPGYMSQSSLRGVLMAGMKPLSQLSYDELLAGGQVVVGNPLTVARRLRELHAELGGFGQLIGLFAIGPRTHEQVRRSTELFASEVMPVLRPLGAAGAARETAG
jgi:alkanesulfonate monooxygenase SsuD/methylene tetrahydromethanopterin reductase-like flavin-dependent oxidoreductase (luciferase family)